LAAVWLAFRAKSGWFLLLVTITTTEGLDSAFCTRAVAVHLEVVGLSERGLQAASA